MSDSVECTEQEIIGTCCHELGHAIILAKQGYKLKSVSVELNPAVTTGIGGLCVTTKPHGIMELFRNGGFSLSDFHDLELAAKLKTMIVTHDHLRSQFLKLLEDGLAVSQSGLVAEVLLYGAFKGFAKMAISDAKFVQLLSGAVKGFFGQSSVSNEFVLDEVAIEFMLAAHPGKGMLTKTIKRIMRELRDDKVTAIVKTMVPRLLSKGKLSKADMRAIEAAFQSA